MLDVVYYIAMLIATRITNRLLLSIPAMRNLYGRNMEKAVATKGTVG